ncbi:MAG: heme biosynthesis protein HemY [Alphaproteobacteria bacterium]
MRRAVGYFIKLGLLVAAAVWLADRPGTVTVDWQGWQLETTTGIAVLALIAVIVATALVWGGWRFVAGLPGALLEFRRTRRRAAGYRALTHGMVAVAAGDAEEARRQARVADGLLDEPPLTLLLSAQAAQLGGDEGAARRWFEKMLENPEMEFLGLRGLIMQALRDGRSEDARALVARAGALRPGAGWVLETEALLAARGGDWRTAQRAVEQAGKRHLLPSATSSAQQAALLVERAREAEAAGLPKDALDQARRAAKLSPVLAPAVVMAARLAAADDRPREARRLLERGWAAAPHPDIAAAWAARAGTDPMARRREMEKLTGASPVHAEGRLALAGAAIEARLWGEARGLLRPLAENGGDARAARLMARLEEAEHGDGGAARAWLERAEAAGPAPAWTCGACGAVADAWSALCGHCHALGTLGWQAPPRVQRAPASLPPVPERADAAAVPAPALDPDRAAQ